MFAIAFGWRHLLFEHYPVPPEVVRPHVPDGLDVDTYDGDAWLSVVPFTNVDVRPLGVPRQFGVRLPELNLRTYVTHGDDDGVYFFSLDAAGILGVLGGRVFHHLPYFYADVTLAASGNRVRFEHRRRHPGARPAEYAATYEPTGELFRPAPGSLVEFLSERYRLYTAAPGGLRVTDVEHPSWPLQEVTADVERDTLFEGDGFEHPDAEPVRYYSPGVDVHASRSRPVE